MQNEVRRSDLVHPQLSYDVVGCAFEIFNEIGFGHLEKYYQRAFAVALKNKKIAFKEQAPYDLIFQETVIGKQYFDFLIEDKLVVELKKDNKFSKKHIDQVNSYLRVSGLQLAILINFSSNGVIYKRILNINSSDS